MEETPIAVITITAIRGVISRTQLDEKSTRVATYPNGHVLPGYGVKTSSEGVQHVRVSPMGKTPQWIRVSERDGSNPLVSIDYVQNPEEALHELSESIKELAKAIRDKQWT